MKTFLFIIALLFLSPAFGQQGDELLVYSLRGNVTVVENSKESKVKIGKVLRPGSTIKTQRDAKLTMVCKEGRPISVTKEGSFPVGIWKDSCTYSHSSVSARYFQYIWDQLYVRSDDYKRDHPEGISGMSEAPVRGPEDKDIVFDAALDTVNYAAGAFPVAWTTSFDYSGKYQFTLVNTKTKKIVYQDSLVANNRPLAQLKKYMRVGNSYSWSVKTSMTELSEGGIINFLPVKTVTRLVGLAKKNTTVPEELAAQYFRIAYMLQEDHYLADAYSYYRKAAAADPTTSFYTEMLEEFKVRFYIH